MGNMTLLKELIDRSGISRTNIAKQLNITYVALNNKLKGKYAFTKSLFHFYNTNYAKFCKNFKYW